MALNVWIDPGHGNSNKGLEYAGFVERHWNLDFATTLASEGWCGDNVKLSREADVSIAYRERARQAYEWRVDLALLIHVNGIFYPPEHHRAGEARSSFHGAMAFTIEGDRTIDIVAETILRAMPHQLWRSDHRVTPFHATQSDWTKDAHGHLHHYFDRGIPAVLLEMGFATNDADRRFLLDLSKSHLLCRAVAAGVEYMIERKKSCNKQ